MSQAQVGSGQRLVWWMRHPFRWQDPYQFFTDGDRHVLEGAIEGVEKSTAVEIRLVVVGAASRQYWALPAFLALLLAVGVLVWVTERFCQGQLGWLGAVFMALTFLTSYPLLGFLLPSSQLGEEEASRAANWLAQQHRAGWDSKELGLLVLVCLLERRVCVWTGDQVAEAMDEDALRNVAMRLQFNWQDPSYRASRLSDSIISAGLPLAQKLPSERDDCVGRRQRIMVRLFPS